MRRATVVTLVSLAIGLAERPARAQEPGAISSAPSVVEPVDNDQAPDAKDTPGARALREGLFVSEALIWAPRSVTRNGVRIPTDTFYRLVGRPDLAVKYRSRRAAKGLLIAA